MVNSNLINEGHLLNLSEGEALVLDKNLIVFLLSLRKSHIPVLKSRELIKPSEKCPSHRFLPLQNKYNSTSPHSPRDENHSQTMFTAIELLL